MVRNLTSAPLRNEQSEWSEAISDCTGTFTDFDRTKTIECITHKNYARFISILFAKSALVILPSPSISTPLLLL